MHPKPVGQQETKYVQPSSSRDDVYLSAVISFFDALNDRGLRYCHWKSNVRLEKSLSGRTDLDLLIDTEHKQLFRKLLADQDIRLIVAPGWKRYPGMEHYLGFDRDSGHLFHLHVHYQLVLGEQYIKNYWLPLEKEMLEATRLCLGVKIPTPELELIVLSLRALLKYRDRDIVKDVLSIRSPGLPEHIIDEIHWLLGQTSLEQVEQTLKSLNLDLAPGIILEFLDIVKVSPRDGMTLFKLRSQARKQLKPYQRHKLLRASLAYFMRLGHKILIQRSAPDRQMTFPDGGLTVALVGVDGAGKSTISAALTDWLRWKIETPFHYLGSKQPSPWTNWSYIFFRMARRGHRELSNLFGQEIFFVKWVASLRQNLLASHYIFVGLDRYRRYRQAQREIASGSIVIFDRYPFAAPLDGPEIHLIDEGNLNPISIVLSRIEKDIYRKFESVNLLILMDVSLETSLRRKPDHPVETIMAKNIALESVKARITQEPDKWNWYSVDAEKPVEDVLLQVKRSVWVALGS